MRAGLSTIQQTLTAEAASVLNHSIAEAARRNHGQTTPLHVAATLLASPTGFLRQACIKSHPNSSHPLQCRALELCFSVALERLPTSATSSSSSSSSDPPISNALMAALKRAQAHQRRGCPEQQQQPLLAVKVELEQLIISILDDPSVSRVMREASFSSPAVKATIEQTLSSAVTTTTTSTTTPTVGIGIYANPRLGGGGGGHSRGEEVKRVIEILSRGKKRNPVLVGDSEPEAVVREVLRRIEAGELGDAAEVVNLDKDLTALEDRIAKSGNGAVVLNLGDLKWLVEQPGQEAVSQLGKLLARFRANDGRLWLIGTATCETYLRCQVYHPSMETDWDLQAVPIAARAPMPGLFSRLGTNGILSSSVESLSPLKGYAAAKLGPPRRPGLSENSDPSRTASCCPVCSHGYEQELAKHVAKESESDVKTEGNRPPLPLWLQNAKSRDGDQQQQSMDQEMVLKQKTRELQKKWSDTCLQLHPSFRQHHHQPHNFGSERMTPTPRTISLPGLYNPSLLARQPFQPKLQMNKTLGVTLQMNSNANLVPPKSPVRTELVLGQNGADDQSPHTDRIKDLIGCISSEMPSSKLASKLDADSFKRLSKGLAEKVWWQPEAAVSVAATMTECRLDSGAGGRKRASKGGDTWVLFLGPDRVGKRKMASALADLVSGSSPAVISLGSKRGENETTGFRGKTVVDKIVEAVRKNPFSVIVLEDVSEADAIVRASVKRAMERGRLGDSHGREVSLGNVVFILTADWLPENLRSKGEPVDEDRLGRLAARPWQLRLAIKTLTKRRRFDLNETAGAELEDFGSNNSSDLTTIEHEDDFVPTPPPREILEAVDDTIVFKLAETVVLRNGIASTVSNRFSSVVGEGVALEMDEDAIEKILSGLWVGKSSLEDFTETVLVPGFRQLKSSLSKDEPMIVRLESDGESERENWLPSSVRVVAP